MPERILVGFSGGVDSAMTALLLRERGCIVEGAFMNVRDGSGHGCGNDGDADSARSLAEALSIPLHVFNLSEAYGEVVLGDFRSEYLAGRTPNPCVLCNPNLKFTLLPRMAREAGVVFDFFATGHYARVAFREDLGRHVLLRGLDSTKDQSYFLHRLDAATLAKVRFPLGELAKKDVRAMAADRGVPVFDKPDSQDFYGGDYAELLEIPDARGEIVMTDGRVVGEHNGFWRFTPGQRKGLGVAYTEPLFVLRLEPETNRVVVATREQELSAGCVAGDIAFPGGLPQPGTVCQGKVRSAQPLRTMRIEASEGGKVSVRFRERLQGIAPGQSLVLYDHDTVLGGGRILSRIS